MPITLRHPSSPAECDLLLALLPSLSFLHLDQAAAPNAFQPLSLYHTDTLCYQEYKHTDLLTHIHKCSAFNPSHAVQTNQQLEPEAFCPSGQPFPAGPSVQKENEPSNPHPASELEVPDSLPLSKSRTVNTTLPHGCQGQQTLLSLFHLFCFAFSHSFSLFVSHSPTHLSFFPILVTQYILQRFDCTKSRGKDPFCRHSS